MSDNVTTSLFIAGTKVYFAKRKANSFLPCSGVVIADDGDSVIIKFKNGDAQWCDKSNRRLCFTREECTHVCMCAHYIR